MREKKTALKFFTICQYQQEEDYLSAMHAQGWQLAKIIFPCFYQFEQCEPKKVAYRLDYNQEGLANKTEYIQMFSDCGWEYLFEFCGYSYFRSQSERSRGQDEIFCDDASRLDLMKRVLRDRMIPLIVMFVLVILPQFAVTTLGYGGGGSIQEGLSVCFLLLAILYLVIFGVTAFQFYQYEKRIWPEKTGIKYKYCGIFGFIVLIVLCMGLFLYFGWTLRD